MTSSDEHASAAASVLPSSRALAIARGLVRTGRATGSEVQGQYLCVTASAGGFYWISFDGESLLRGEIRQHSEQLQPGFADAMARAGTDR